MKEVNCSQELEIVHPLVLIVEDQGECGKHIEDEAVEEVPERNIAEVVLLAKINLERSQELQDDVHDPDGVDHLLQRFCVFIKNIQDAFAPGSAKIDKFELAKIRHLRIGNEDDLDQECEQEKDLPEVKHSAVFGVLDDQVLLAPVPRLLLIFSISAVVFVHIVIFLEEELHEVLIAISAIMC